MGKDFAKPISLADWRDPHQVAECFSDDDGVPRIRRLSYTEALREARLLEIVETLEHFFVLLEPIVARPPGWDFSEKFPRRMLLQSALSIPGAVADVLCRQFGYDPEEVSPS